jgi:hypothetical protein
MRSAILPFLMMVEQQSKLRLLEGSKVMPGFELSGGVEGVHTRWRIASVEFELHFFGHLRVRSP